MRGRTGQIVASLLLIGIGVVYAAPLGWMVLTSAQSAREAITPGSLPDPAAVPAQLAANYRAVWTDPVVDFPLYLRNSLWVAGMSLVGMMLAASISAYGFARVRWRGRDALFTLVLASMMIPFAVLMGPLYVIFRELGWIGTFLPLWAPAWLAFGGGFNIFLLRQFYRTIPAELDEAARLDGCSHWGIFRHVILPLSRPALAVVALFHFTAVWNDFLAPLIFLTHRDQFTLALGLHLYQSQAGETPWNLLMAASTLVVAPVIALFFLTQGMLREGIATSGLKE